MKNRILILALLLLSTAAFSQKKTAKPQVSAAEKQKANQMIAYTNNVSSFLSEYLSINAVAVPINSYNENVASDNIFINPETLEENFKTVSEAITDFKEEKGVDISVPPAVIGVQNQAFIKAKFEIYHKLYETIKLQNNKLKPYTIETGGDINKKDNTAVRNIVKQMNETLDQIYTLQDDMYDKLDEIGYQAEEITLRNHPMKTEILDMKNVMTKSAKIYKLMANKPSDVKEKLPEINSILAPLTVIASKYGESYSQKTSASTSIELRGAVHNFYIQFDNYNFHLNNAMKGLQTNNAEVLDNWSDFIASIKDSYGLLISEYNTFADVNNNE